MKCPQCAQETRSQDTGQTLVGYSHHDDNCVKRYYHCTACNYKWIESLQRRCLNCDWTGRSTCGCHKNPKVTMWTDEPHNEERWHKQSTLGCKANPC